MPDFDFEEERIKQEIKRFGAKRVLLQMPEGLKPKAPTIAKIIESCGALAVISADPCYGACDLAVAEAQDLEADLIVHFGHASFLKKSPVPTLYVEARAGVSVEAAVLAALPLLRDYGKIGLAASVQHLDKLNQAKQILEEAGKMVAVGDSKQVPYAGQALGCNYSNVTVIADEVDAFLFLGGGLFHALGIALSTAKPTIIADPYDNRAFSVNEEAQRMVKQRFASIQQAKTAKAFGVFVGLKPGQKHLDAAMKVKAQAQKHGLEAFLLAAREVTPETLLEFPTIDAYVNTACPRISMEAPGKFGKPVLTVNEFLVVIGEVSWESLLKKGLFAN